MILYLIKTILCSALLLIVYILFFEKEKMHRFNRAYLLFSIVLSFLIPLISFTRTIDTAPDFINQFINLPEGSSQQISISKATDASTETTYLPVTLVIIYLFISCFVLTCFCRNIWLLFKKIGLNPHIAYNNSRLVLTNDIMVAHSFFQYIFINKDDYEKGIVEREIIHHELTHVKQQHSLDIIFIELLLIFYWINPLLFLFRKAIRLNHEFLADDAVVTAFNNTLAYQFLLLEKSSGLHGLSLTSQFNYLTTKKRLLMMTKQTSASVVILKQVMLLPVLTMAIFLFSTKLIAQDSSKVTAQVQQKIPFTKEGVSQDLLNEYKSTINKYKADSTNWTSEFSKRLTPVERERMETIYKKMSKAQQTEQIVVFWPAPGPLPVSVPTIKQFEAFKNATVFGVWIDDKKVSNNVLNNYSNTDFKQTFVSKLYGVAKKGKSYTYQVDLMTIDKYDDYYKKTIASQNKMVIMFKMPVKK